MNKERTVLIAAIFALSLSPAACELLVDTTPLDPATPGGQSEASSDTSSGDALAPNDGETPNDAALAPDAACPGDAGRSMVRVGTFCIDSSEVTNLDYEAFLAASPSVSTYAPPACAFKNNFDHDGTWTPMGTGSFPAAEVDWCDAYAYCKWAGKRLCGDLGGGEVPFASFADPSRDQWFVACSDAGSLVYPYGNTFDETKCNTEFADGGQPAGGYKIEQVENRPSCQGSALGIYDMSGNMAEWEDSCNEAELGDAAAQHCRLRGGSAHSDSDHARCDTAIVFSSLYKRSDRDDDLGFRCCSP